MDAPQLSAAGYERRKPALGLDPFLHVFVHQRIGRPQSVQREHSDVHGLVSAGRDIAVRRLEVDVRKIEEDPVAVLELPLDRHRLHLVEHGEEFVPEHANALLRNQVHLPVGAQGVEPVLEIAVVEDQVGRRDRLHPPDILPAVALQFRGELQLLEGPPGGVAHFVLVKPFEELEPVQVVVFAVELRRQRIGRRGKFGRGV